jgi:hypothetical protein
MGFLESMLVPTSGLYFASQLSQMLVTTLLILYWVVVDANERGVETSKALRVMIVLLAIVAVPYYLLRTRGIRGISSVVLAAAFVLFLGFVESSAAWITWSLRAH